MTNIEEILERIRQALSGLKYGEITIKVHDGKVKFIERKEQEKID